MSTDEPSIELSADSDTERAGMPSSRPMTLRQQLDKKVRRVFTNRTHKFPDKKVEIIQTPETRNQRFIIAPYDQTIEKIVKLVESYSQEIAREAYEKGVKDGRTA